MKNLYNEVKRAFAWIFFFLLAFVGGCTGGAFSNHERDAALWDSSDSGTLADVATGGASALSSQTMTSSNTTGGATGSLESLPTTSEGGQLAALGGAGSGGVSTATTSTGGSGIEVTGGAAATGGAATGGDVATGGAVVTGGAAATGGAATGGATTDPGKCPCPQRAECAAYTGGCNLPGSKASDWPNEYGLQCVTSPLQCPTAARPVYCFLC